MTHQNKNSQLSSITNQLYLHVDAHHLEYHLHRRAADDAAVFLVEALEALLQRLDLLQVEAGVLLNGFALPLLRRCSGQVLFIPHCQQLD